METLRKVILISLLRLLLQLFFLSMDAGVSLSNSANFQQDEDSAATGSGSGNIIGHGNTQKS